VRTTGSIALSWTTMVGPHLEGRGLSRFRSLWEALRLLCGEATYLYLMVHSACGLLGLAAFATRVGTFLFAVHLFDLVLVNETLHIVLRSITHNSKQLIVTSLFACIVVYVYAIIGFVVFQKDFKLFVLLFCACFSHSPLFFFFFITRTEAGEPLCTTLPQCFVLMLYEGLRNGGGIGDVLSKPVFEDYFFFLRVLYDSSFWIICILILLNSFLGIIVDTFGELRQRKQNADADFRSKCFICGCERGSFELEAGGFEKHTKVHHNVWNYVYFFAHLRMNKDESDYTGAVKFLPFIIYEKKNISPMP
jgi:hypothetical protein